MNIHLVLALLGSLLIGLFVYERLGWRLGGVLVLPLVLIYALFEPKVVPAFLAGVVLTFAIGWLVQRHTLIYGRRLLYVFVVAGFVVTASLLVALRADVHGIVLAVLPGVFAFNLQREGYPTRSVAQFAAIFLPVYVAAHVLLLPFGFEGGLFAYFPKVHHELALVLPGIAPGLGAEAAAALPVASAAGTYAPMLLDTDADAGDAE